MAVTVIADVPAAAAEEAVSFSVVKPLPAVSIAGLLLHEAVTPAGSPLTLRVTVSL